jgi:hypothetical protein
MPKDPFSNPFSQKWDHGQGGGGAGRPEPAAEEEEEEWKGVAGWMQLVRKPAELTQKQAAQRERERAFADPLKKAAFWERLSAGRSTTNCMRKRGGPLIHCHL